MVRRSPSLPDHDKVLQVLEIHDRREVDHQVELRQISAVTTMDDDEGSFRRRSTAGSTITEAPTPSKRWPNFSLREFNAIRFARADNTTHH
ncbi:hypothetical protein PybrP1_000785 [[Pythium] brassicae (nom. inval.)]|nr:hypothetical protein PybrP1_000785 [[Pythium] brassicae (nom. inval.)]